MLEKVHKIRWGDIEENMLEIEQTSEPKGTLQVTTLTKKVVN